MADLASQGESTTFSAGRLATGKVVDLVVRDGTVTSVAATATASGAATVDLAGWLVLAAPAEPHVHLDKAGLASVASGAGTDLAAAIAEWRGCRERLDVGDISARARETALGMLDRGVTAIRTHVDAGAAVGTKFVETMTALRAELADHLSLQVVAMADTPLTGPGGPANLGALSAALDAGADVVGGAPWRDPDPEGAVAALLELASRRGAPVDLHTDETVDPTVRTLADLPRQVARFGVTSAVTVSHCVSLASQELAVAARTAETLAEAGIAVVACPATNLLLQGRDAMVHKPRGLTALGLLRMNGVALAAGGDNMQDFFNPLGSGDPLVTAGLLVLAGHLSVDEAYAAVSTTARRVMGVPGADLSVGSRADFLAVRAPDLRSALADPQRDRIVVRAGRIVSRTTLQTDRYLAR